MSKEKAELAANANLWHPFSAQGGGSPHGRCSANSAPLSSSKRQPSATQAGCQADLPVDDPCDLPTDLGRREGGASRGSRSGAKAPGTLSRQDSAGLST